MTNGRRRMYAMIAMRKAKREGMVKIPYKHQLPVKPPYYKVLWHNCTKCRTHYTSEEPHLRAYLCDECWKSMPHYRAKKKTVMKSEVKVEKRWKELSDLDWPFEYILLYILGCSLCLLTIAYYLWFK